MATVNKTPTKQFSVKFPQSMVEEIDTICNATFTTRTSWLLKAAQEKIDKERSEREKQLKAKLTDI